MKIDEVYIINDYDIIEEALKNYKKFAYLSLRDKIHKISEKYSKIEIKPISESCKMYRNDQKMRKQIREKGYRLKWFCEKCEFNALCRYQIQFKKLKDGFCCTGDITSYRSEIRQALQKMDLIIIDNINPDRFVLKNRITLDDIYQALSYFENNRTFKQEDEDLYYGLIILLNCFKLTLKINDNQVNPETTFNNIFMQNNNFGDLIYNRDLWINYKQEMMKTDETKHILGIIFQFLNSCYEFKKNGIDNKVIDRFNIYEEFRFEFDKSKHPENNILIYTFIKSFKDLFNVPIIIYTHHPKKVANLWSKLFPTYNIKSFENEKVVDKIKEKILKIKTHDTISKSSMGRKNFRNKILNEITDEIKKYPENKHFIITYSSFDGINNSFINIENEIKDSLPENIEVYFENFWSGYCKCEDLIDDNSYTYIIGTPKPNVEKLVLKLKPFYEGEKPFDIENYDEIDNIEYYKDERVQNGIEMVREHEIEKILLTYGNSKEIKVYNNMLLDYLYEAKIEEITKTIDKKQNLLKFIQNEIDVTRKEIHKKIKGAPKVITNLRDELILEGKVVEIKDKSKGQGNKMSIYIPTF